MENIKIGDCVNINECYSYYKWYTTKTFVVIGIKGSIILLNDKLKDSHNTNQINICYLIHNIKTTRKEKLKRILSYDNK